jgi:NaMN:DMB phosphoribosyltransferase
MLPELAVIAGLMTGGTSSRHVVLGGGTGGGQGND